MVITSASSVWMEISQPSGASASFHRMMSTGSCGPLLRYIAVTPMSRCSLTSSVSCTIPLQGTDQRIMVCSGEGPFSPLTQMSGGRLLGQLRVGVADGLLEHQLRGVVAEPQGVRVGVVVHAVDAARLLG